METKKKSGGILSIIGIVIIGAFASVVGKSCGKSLASNRVTASQETPAPPSRSELTNYDVAGLSLDLPGRPTPQTMQLPAGASNVISNFNTYAVNKDSTKIGITYAEYVNPEVNLDGSADGAIAGVRSLSTVSEFSSSKSEVTVAGLPGREFKMNYKNSRFQMNEYGLVFATGGRCWQIHIIGEGTQNQAALQELKDAIFESITIKNN